MYTSSYAHLTRNTLNYHSRSTHATTQPHTTTTRNVLTETHTTISFFFSLFWIT